MVSQTVNQPKQETEAGKGSSIGRQRGQVGKPRQQGKIYVMAQQEVEETPYVVVC